MRSRYLSPAIWLSVTLSVLGLYCSSGWSKNTNSQLDEPSEQSRHWVAQASQLLATSEELPKKAPEEAIEEMSEEAPEEAGVLVIHSYNLDFDWTRRQKLGIDQTFAQGERNVVVYHEFLDAKRHPNLDYSQDFLSYVQQKYKDVPLQVLMISDDPGLNLILENRDQYFPNLPVVFMGINKVRPEILNIPWLTGAFEARRPMQTALEARRQTGSEHLIIISDSSATGQANLKLLDDLVTTPGGPREIVLVEDLTADEIAQKVGIYPDDWPVFMAGQLRQDTADGPLLNLEKDAEILRSQVPNPIYTDTLPRLGNGAVGGKVLDGEYHAQQAVQLVEQLLEGTAIEEIDPLIESENRWIFDARELERVRIKKDQLPEGSLLINEEPSFYEQYKSLVWLTATGFSFGLITIVVLSHAVGRQKQAEKRLKESEKQLEQNVLDRTAQLSETLQELKQTQAQLIQTEKLSSLGQLVGGIAHEFNNPLSFIHSNLKHLQGYIESLLALIALYQNPAAEPHTIEDHTEDMDLAYLQQDAPRLIESTKRGTHRIQTIVRTLQNFARSDEQGIKPTDLNQSMEDTLLVLNTQLGDEIEVVKDYGTLPLVKCRPGDINQVFMSILLNAIAALENRPAQKIHIQTSASPDDRVKIMIEDNGSGIPTHIQDKVFDPFFTTKPIGQGTGLGLALCYQTIQLHDGKIQLQSKPGEGTQLLIEMPVR